MKRIFILTSLLLALGACGGGDDTVDFNSFVIDEISNTAATDDPAGINSTVFRFSNENEQAFDLLL